MRVTLYEVGPHDREIQKELTSSQLVTRNLSCFDRETVDLIGSAISLDVSSVRNEPPDDKGFMHISDDRSNFTVDLPHALNLQFSDQIQPTEPVANYHLNHLATISRILNDVEFQNATLRYRDAYPVSNVTFREDEVDVVQLPYSGVSDEPSGLQLRRVPVYCKALLSDKECVQNAVRSTLPHSLDEIKSCVDVMFQNLVKFHSFYRLPSAQLNVTRLSNNCIQDSLKRFSERTVKCFHGPANESAVDSNAWRYNRRRDPQKTFSFDFDSIVKELKSNSASRLTLAHQLWAGLLCAVSFHLVTRDA